MEEWQCKGTYHTFVVRIKWDDVHIQYTLLIIITMCLHGNSSSLQYSGLENSMDYTVHAVAKSQTQLSDFHMHTHTFTHLLNKTELWIRTEKDQWEAVYCFPLQTRPHSPGPFSPPLLSKVFEKKAGPIIWSVTKWTLHGLHFLIHKEEIIIIANNFTCQTLSWKQSMYSLV